MSTGQNKDINRHLIKEAWNKGNLTLLDEVCDPDYVLHDSTTTIHGVEGMKQYISRDRTAFPDVCFTIEEQIAEGNAAVTRFTCQGTHLGNLAGIAPTGKRITVSGMILNRFVNGRLVEAWIDFDTFGMMRQLGQLPPL